MISILFQSAGGRWLDASAFPSVRLKKPGEKPRSHPRLPPAGGSVGRNEVEDGGGRGFCFARNSAQPKGKIPGWSRCGRGWPG